jgi:hypothetical protein
MKEAGDVSEAYIVLPKIEHSAKESGVIALADVSALFAEINQKDEELIIETSLISVPTRSVFVAMPFDVSFEDVYWFAAAYAAEQAKVVARRTDKDPFEGDVVAEIHRCIHNSVAVIADLSEARANVMYEVGYAHALGRAVIPICRTPLDKLPFDVRNWNVLPYSAGNVYAIREKLAKRLKAAID